MINQEKIFVLYLSKYGICIHRCMVENLMEKSTLKKKKQTTFFMYWVVMLCGLLGRYQHFGETYCLHIQGCSGFESTHAF
jgi:hypothetical protein